MDGEVKQFDGDTDVGQCKGLVSMGSVLQKQVQPYGTRTCFTCSTRSVRQDVLLGRWVSSLHAVTM